MVVLLVIWIVCERWWAFWSFIGVGLVALFVGQKIDGDDSDAD